MASLRLEKVDKIYPNGQEAVRGIDLDVRELFKRRDNLHASKIGCRQRFRKSAPAR